MLSRRIVCSLPTIHSQSLANLPTSRLVGTNRHSKPVSGYLPVCRPRGQNLSDSPLIPNLVSCCDGSVHVACQPCAALASHVEELWYCDGHQGVHGTQRVLPDGRFQLAISLAEGPISALTDPMGDGGGIAPSLLIGIRSRFSIIDTAKLRSAMRVVFRPGGVHAFLEHASRCVSQQERIPGFDLGLDGPNLARSVARRKPPGREISSARSRAFGALKRTRPVECRGAVCPSGVRAQTPDSKGTRTSPRSRSEPPPVCSAVPGADRTDPEAVLPTPALSKHIEADCVWRFRRLGTVSSSGGLLRSGPFSSRIPCFLGSLSERLSDKRWSLRESCFYRLNQLLVSSHFYKTAPWLPEKL